jgi:3-oxoacyl-ACP reductase-like protein
MYQFEGEPQSAPASSGVAAAASAPFIGAVIGIYDVPLKAANILAIVLVQKLKKKTEEIHLSRSFAISRLS